MKYEYYHLGRVKPDAVIGFINKIYPEHEGQCVYDPTLKKLKSKQPDICEFYFDPFHGVLEVAYKVKD